MKSLSEERLAFAKPIPAGAFGIRQIWLMIHFSNRIPYVAQVLVHDQVMA
jgi:hypothetical protein